MTRAPLLAVLALSEVLLSRLPWPIPDFPGGNDTIAILTPWGANVRYLDLWSKLASHRLLSAAALELGVVVLVAWVISRWETGQGDGPVQRPIQRNRV